MTFVLVGSSASTYAAQFLAQSQQAYAACQAGPMAIGPIWTSISTLQPPAPPLPPPPTPPLATWAGQRRVSITLEGISYDGFASSVGWPVAFQLGIATALNIIPNAVEISPGFTGTASSVALAVFIDAPTNAQARALAATLTANFFNSAGVASPQMISTWQALGLPLTGASTPVAATGHHRHRALLGVNVRGGANDAGTDSSSAATVPATSSATAAVTFTSSFSSNAAASSLNSWSLHNLGASPNS